MAWSLGSGALAFGLGSRFPELGEMLDFGGWLIQVGREAFAGSPAGRSWLVAHFAVRGGRG